VLWSQKPNGKPIEIGPCSFLQGWSISIGELQLWWKYVINHVKNSRNTILMKKRTNGIVFNESHFDSQLLQLLQWVNTWLVELWDDCEHSNLKKHNGKLLWLQNL
jgi:hypothetical protein